MLAVLARENGIGVFFRVFFRVFIHVSPSLVS